MTRDRQHLHALPVRAPRGAGLRAAAALTCRPYGLPLPMLRLP